MNERAKRSDERCPTHPGALLREIVLPALHRPKAEIAGALGISRQTLYDILNERQPVTPHMAVRLGKLFGNTPQVWLKMQMAYDLWHAGREVDTDSIPALKAAGGHGA